MKLSALLACLVIPFVAASPSAPLWRRSPLHPTVKASVAVSPSGGGTYPRLTLVNGNILAGFTAFSGSTHLLTVTRSTDGGNTWANLGVVATGTGDLDNINLLQLPNGNVLATFRNHDKTNGAYTYYRITACISTDGGATWSFLSQVDQRAASGVNGLWEPFARTAKSGALQVYYASENSAADQDILMRSSTDGGATWSGAITVAGSTTTGRDGMPGCADFNDGAAKVLCVFETTEGTGTFTVKSVVSTNDGASFAVSTRSQVYVPTGTSNNAGAPQVVTTTGGTLVVSFMTDEDTSEHSWTNGANMKILTSNSVQPESWGQKTTVFPVQANWPGLLAKTDGTILGCADYNGAKCSSISFS